MNLMERDIASLNVVEISAEVSALACRLLMKHKLPAGDALHLASALLVNSRRLTRDAQKVRVGSRLPQSICRHEPLPVRRNSSRRHTPPLGFFTEDLREILIHIIKRIGLPISTIS